MVGVRTIRGAGLAIKVTHWRGLPQMAGTCWPAALSCRPNPKALLFFVDCCPIIDVHQAIAPQVVILAVTSAQWSS